jgi:hypothetical protein
MRIASRSLLLACGALAATAALALVAASLLPVFEPCRVLYRTHQLVQDSAACQVHSGLGLLAVLSLLAALGAGLAGVVRLYRGSPPQ